MSKKNKQPYYSMRAQSADAAVIYIFGDIEDWKWVDEDVTPTSFLADLAALGDVSDIDLQINTRGGSVFAGIAIYNVLRSHKAKVTVTVAGLAASIGSVIAMAGDTIIMPGNAVMMIHDPSTYAGGNPADLRKVADILDGIKQTLVNTYHDKTGLDHETIKQMMADETWMTASQALELGFADKMIDPVDIAASAKFDLSVFNKAPDTALFAAGPPPVSQTHKTEEVNAMTIEQFLAQMNKNHPTFLAIIQSEARQGLVPKADVEGQIEAAVAKAKEGFTDNGPAVLAMVETVFPEEIGTQFKALLDSGVTAEQAKTLGVTVAASVAGADAETRKLILAGITNAAPEGMQAAQPETAAEAELNGAVSAIAAGGSIK